jgi:tRNA(fMet)-specific endonuclease VapC
VKYLVDSDWLIDVRANILPAYEMINRLSADGVATSIITVGELYDGAIGSADSAATLMSLRQVLGAFPVLPLNDAIMEAFAPIRVPLRRQGLLIPDLDMLIAATAISYDLTLLSRNRRHFQRIPGLALYQPT